MKIARPDTCVCGAGKKKVSRLKLVGGVGAGVGAGVVASAGAHVSH